MCFNCTIPQITSVGVFLSESSLIDWYSRMKVKMPQIYQKDDEIFGNDSGQHAYGTRLLTHIINEPVAVLGSRWKKDGLSDGPGMVESKYSCVDGREPMYVVLMDDELTQIELMDAHRRNGKRGRWWVVGQDPKVNTRLDTLARAHKNQHQNIQNEHSKHEDQKSDGESSNGEVDDPGIQNRLQRRKRETLKRLRGVDCPLDAWDESVHGHFLAKFFVHSFSASEQDRILSSSGVSISSSDGGGNNDGGKVDIIAEGIKAFETQLQPEEENFSARLVLAKMVAYFVNGDYGAVILCNQRETKFQAIELKKCLVSLNLVPIVEITYATDPEGIERPTEYLNGDKVKVMRVSNALAVSLENHLLNSVSNDWLNDTASGLLYHEGFLVPMDIVSFNDHKGHDIGIDTDSNLPDINFGVELELSCASGNYQEKIALSIAKHAQVDVRVDMHSGKGGKGGGSSGGRKGGGFGGKGKKVGQSNRWKLVYDKSIEPNVPNPQSLTFELVSPILSGAQGLDVLSNTVAIVYDVACVRLNNSMGLHVHVEAKEELYSLESMKSICQQFLLYEDTIDSFLPYYRRTGSDKSHSYFESNLLSVMSLHDTLESSLTAVFACESRDDLYDLMNPGIRERYHKMNLQNLKTCRQPTIEFRQHHATKDVNEILCWVRFCVLFVTNAKKIPPIDSVTKREDEADRFGALFHNIIQCPILNVYYSKKRRDFARRC